jgi:hypothetical protein
MQDFAGQALQPPGVLAGALIAVLTLKAWLQRTDRYVR